MVKCVVCKQDTGGKHYGFGGPFGSSDGLLRFACPECYWRSEAEKLQKRLDLTEDGRLLQDFCDIASALGCPANRESILTAIRMLKFRCA